MTDHRAKLDKDTRAALDEALPGYTVTKSTDHYMLEYKGRRIGIVGGNDTKRQRQYQLAKIRTLVRRALELTR